jgi:type I restriction enzyme S subunit
VNASAQQIPKSWENLTFEQAIEPVTDEGKRVDRSDYLAEGSLPVVDQGDEFIGGYTNDNSKRYNGPLPVIVFGDHTRRVKLVDFPFVVGAQGVKLLKPRECWEPRFLAYLLPTLPLPDRGYGRHYQYLRQLRFLCPPKFTQRQIVAEIEKQFTRLDAGVAGLRRVQANLKRYRAAVLKAACEGKLVPTQAEIARQEGRSYETGDQLLERLLAERRKKWSGKGKYKEPAKPDRANLPELPEGWTWARLDAISALKGGITVDKNRKSPTARSVAYLRVANVQRGYLDLVEIKTIEAPENDITELRLVPGDILFTEGGDRDKLGRGWIWQGQISECIHQNHVFRARLYSDAIEPKLVSWWGNSFGQVHFLREGKQTTNLASINLSKLSQFPIPVPPMPEQQRIVAEIERRLSVVEELETVVNANLQRSTRLRQSILQRAFEGNFVSRYD